MRLLDRIALNRLLSILTGFILALTKIIVSGSKTEEENSPEPEERKPWIRRRKKQ